MKKLLLGVAVACIIGLTVENVLVSKSHQEYSDLFLANVEALADHEWDQGQCWH